MYVLNKLTVFIYVGKTNGYQMFYAIKMHYPFYILVFELHVHIKRPFKKKIFNDKNVTTMYR